VSEALHPARQALKSPSSQQFHNIITAGHYHSLTNELTMIVQLYIN